MENMEDVDDIHLCLRCKTKITGLDNYISHRHARCGIRAVPLPLANESSVKLSVPKENANASHFFTSLELKSTSNSVIGPANKANDKEILNTLNYGDVESDNSDFESHPPKSHTGGKWEPGTRPELTYLDEEIIEGEGFSPKAHTTGGKWGPQLALSTAILDAHSSNNGAGSKPERSQNWESNTCPIKLLASEKETNGSYPPKNHTGGKWEPGTRPELTNEPTTFEIKYTINLQSYNSEPTLNEAGDRILPFTEHNNETDIFKNTCTHCNLDFNNEKSLLLHQFSNEHKLKFRTLYDWSMDTTNYQLKRVHFLFPYQCNICSFHALNSETFSRHLTNKSHLQKTARLRRPMLCLICQFDCHSSDEMLSHIGTDEHETACEKMISTHPVMIIEKSYRFRCSFCNGQCSLFVNKKLMKNSYNCVYCDVSFISKPVLRCHIQKSHRREHLISTMNRIRRNKLICSLCLENFQSSVQLKSHFMEVHSEHTISCTVCNRMFISEEDLIKHKRTKHHQIRMKTNKPSSTNENLFECDSCKYSTTSKTELCIHRVQHTGPVIKRRYSNKWGRYYACTFCSKLFTLSALRIHLLVHTGERPFHCHICQRRFARRGTLRIHMKLHMKAKQFCSKTCQHNVPSKKFKNSEKAETKRSGCCPFQGENATEHQKDYLCDTCGHNARSLPVLKRHQRLHTGEKPFKCNHCEYKSSSNSNLLRHLRLHSGSKPYKCPYCSYLCNNQENIRKHILKTKKHAGKNVYPCKHCDYGCNKFAIFKSHMLEQHKDLLGDKDSSSVMSNLYVKDYPRQFKGKPEEKNKLPKNNTLKGKSTTESHVDLIVVRPVLFLGLQDNKTASPIMITRIKDSEPQTTLGPSSPVKNLTQYRPLLPKGLPAVTSPVETKNPFFFTLVGQNQPIQINPQSLDPMEQHVMPMVNIVDHNSTNQTDPQALNLHPLNSQNMMHHTNLKPILPAPSNSPKKISVGESFRELVQATISDKEVPVKVITEQTYSTSQTIFKSFQRQAKPNTNQAKTKKVQPNFQRILPFEDDHNMFAAQIDAKLNSPTNSTILKKPESILNNPKSLENCLPELQTFISDECNPQTTNYLENNENIVSTHSSIELGQYLETQPALDSDKISLNSLTEDYTNIFRESEASSSAQKMAYFNGKEYVIIQKEQYERADDTGIQKAERFFRVIEDEDPTNNSVVLLEMDNLIDEQTGNVTREALDAVNHIPMTTEEQVTSSACSDQQTEKTIFIYMNQKDNNA